ncbi:MAG TPA: hypothetical protein VE967_06385, partial [Gemmatimonadaceae bacterium]|nr:hypothetical protein [Gemmatimonadaceae bacterium]
MIESHPRSAFVRFAAIAVACVALLVFHACSDATGPGSRAHAHGARLAFNPVFQTTNGTVQFEKVHILLHRTDGSVALDTLISFPADADELTLSFEVPFSLSADASGENFVLNLEMLNAAGDVVYRGGPIQVHAAAAGTAAPPPVDIPTTYTGPGATATRVEILPGALTVSPNAIVNFTATAFDESGAVLPGTPIQFSSLDPAIATVPDPTLARVVAGLARGTARIRATTVTGKTADALLTVRPAAVSVALDAGNAQSGTVATTLPVPLRVKVLASDGLGIDGTVVTFAITNGSGTLGAAQITTDAQGLAGTTLTLPNTPGTVTVTATASGLTGSPVTFTATATSGAASQLVFAQQPANGTTGITLPLITVQARDVQGNLTTGFTGQVTLALDNPPAGVTLQGTTAVAAV